MAFGDQSSSGIDLMLTCKTREDGHGVPLIRKGDAVRLVGDLTVCNELEFGNTIFGQAMAEARGSNVAVPVKVRGICIFQYSGHIVPLVNGLTGVMGSPGKGVVAGCLMITAHSGINVKVDEENRIVHTLL